MHVVIAGGGVAALEAAIALRDLAGERVSITMLAPEEDFVFKPLSVGEPFALGDAQHVPLKKFAADLGSRARAGRARLGIARGRSCFRRSAGDEISYDKLIARDRALLREAAVRVRDDVSRAGGQREVARAGAGR